tara:strand:- start:1731 stop:3518 length:1788 start_codon:yes stop_codon:yes gene_type:complete
MQGETYKNREEEFKGKAKRIGKQLFYLSMGRLVLFLALIYVGYMLFTTGIIGLILLLLAGLFGFIALIKRGANLKEDKAFYEAVAAINKEEIASLDGNWNNRFDGAKYRKEAHPYAYDLDIFGKRSIFQWINRAETFHGQDKLAGWLANANLSAASIHKKQEAVKELSKALDFRQKLGARGRVNQLDKSTFEEMIEWLQKPTQVVGKRWALLLSVIPVIMLLSTLAWGLGYLTSSTYTYFIVGSMAITGFFLKKINEEYAVATKVLSHLKTYAVFFELIAEQNFESEVLQALQKKLDTEKGAAHSIRSFHKVLEAFDNRNNILIGIVLNILFLWDLNCVWRIQKWKSKHQADYKAWFDALSEIEAYSGLANLHYNQPAWAFPETNSSYRYQYVEAGHPFINDRERVNNNFELSGEGHFAIVTGANMAGKSTFLRSVGINLVLAMAGAPVCAKAFTFTPVQLFSSMRTEDSLQDQASYFFAELSRLKQIVDRLNEGERLFIILDEILKGTNSEDKASGSKAFLRSLTGKKAMGAIATHDLSLCDLETELPESVKNFSFEVEFAGDDLKFDYKLRKGVCQNMNATFLMKKMGIIPSE